jgi:undecaprenyl-diphosphatase
MDARLFRWMNHLADRTDWAHGVAKFWAVYGIVVVGVILVAAWWDARSTERPVAAVAAVVWPAAAAVIGVGLVQVIGGAIDRARPTTVLHGTHLLLDKTADFSFPSDHLTAMSAVAAGLFLAAPLLRRRWYGWAAAAFALLMAFTRVYVGAHYPGDVLGGIVLGTAVAVGFAKPGRWLLERIADSLTRSPLRPLVSKGAINGATPDSLGTEPASAGGSGAAS